MRRVNYVRSDSCSPNECYTASVDSGQVTKHVNGGDQRKPIPIGAGLDANKYARLDEVMWSRLFVLLNVLRSDGLVVDGE